MKHLFTRLCATAIGLLSLSGSAQAQYVFKSTPDAESKGLAPYEQNFDALSGTNAQFVNNTTLTGVYANFTLNSYSGYEFASNYDGKILPADNGSKGSSVNTLGQPNGAGWYHFGSNTVNTSDRALGGIAATTTDNGVGHIGIRLRNSSGVAIKNLEIAYAMEQWFNSGKIDNAQVKVAFRKTASGATTNTSLVSGTWTDITELLVKAPSTSTAILNSDGNSPSNRRVVRAKLIGGKTSQFGSGLNQNEEIMIRWSYVFNSATNGNGLSLDDVVITPETNVFYSSVEGKLNNLNKWGINSNGTGTHPASFALDNTTYYVRGTAPLTDRLSGAATLGISGANSRLVVGTPTEPATLYLPAADDIKATVDVAANSTLQIEKNTTLIKLGSLNNSSLVEYIAPVAGGEQHVQAASYGQIKLTKAGTRRLDGNAIISSNATFELSSGASTLALGAYDFTLLKEATLLYPTGLAQFVTNDAGGLRQTVTSTGVEVTFPVAATNDIADYTPVILSQTAPKSEDTYKVRVIAGVFSVYTNEVGSMPIQANTIDKTWFISEEVPGYSDITLQAFWNKKDEQTGFNVQTAYVDHYNTSVGSWDRKKGDDDEDVEGKPKGKKKKGLKNFSPFTVTSIVPAPLPVQLVRFDAQRKGTAVVCTWATASELNNDYFEVERMLDGQTSFHTLGRIAGSGTTSQGQTYTFSDNQPSATAAYYRLRQIDVDGTPSFSSVAMVAGTGMDALVSLVPNPSAGRFELRTNFAQPTRLQGGVLNAVGRQVQALDTPVMAGPAATMLDLSSQPAGIYILQLRTSRGLTTLRMVKQ